MTQDEALSCLTELKALERLHAVIAAMPAPAFEWKCALTAIDDRLRWVRYCLSREDPAMLGTVEELYTYQLLQSAADVIGSTSDPMTPMPDLPRAARVH